MDRYLSQSLGIPVSLPDLEIDVCVSGRREIHEPDRLDGLPEAGLHDENETQDHIDDHQTPNAHTASRNVTESSSREVVLANFVEYGTSHTHPAQEIF
jgi:hypothetical protein